MGTLDDVTNLREQGISDNEIIASLRGRGVSPKEINDALSQAQVKNAVGSAEPGMESSIMDSSPSSDEVATSSVGSNYSGGAVEQEAYAPAGQDVNYAPIEDVPQMGADNAAGGGYQDDYGGGGGYGGDTDTIIEVSQQVFIEKAKKMNKHISENTEFRVLAASKIDNISERLKRIENSIDNLQHAILEKVGEYGGGLQSIKKEMDMMQDSFKKVVGGKR